MILLVLLQILIVILMIYISATLICRKRNYISVLFEHFSNVDPEGQKRIARLKNTMKDVHQIIKELDVREGEKSYTLNKKNVYLCLKDKKTGGYYTSNMLTYVLLHELAHVLNKDVGHTESFHRVFDNLLKRAEQVGCYDPSIPVTENYCESV